MKKNNNVLNDLVKTIKKKKNLANTVVDTYLESNQQIKGAISSGSLALDAITGIGGLPVGKIVEYIGVESSGKTALSLCAIARAQREGKLCAFIDGEYSLEVDWASKLGVNVEDLMLLRPTCLEDALETMKILIKDGRIDLLVYDSVPALAPRDEIEKGTGKVASRASLLTSFIQQSVPFVYANNITVIFINQVREDFGKTFGFVKTYATPGGRALKHGAVLRIFFNKASADYKRGQVAIGHAIKAKIKKNKVGPPNGFVVFDFFYNKGISDSYSSVGLFLGIIKKVSPRKFVFGEKEINGAKNLSELDNDPELIKLVEATMQQYRKDPSLLEKRLDESFLSQVEDGVEVELEELEGDEVLNELLDEDI